MQQANELDCWAGCRASQFTSFTLLNHVKPNDTGVRQIDFWRNKNDELVSWQSCWFWHIPLAHPTPGTLAKRTMKMTSLVSSLLLSLSSSNSTSVWRVIHDLRHAQQQHTTGVVLSLSLSPAICLAWDWKTLHWSPVLVTLNLELLTGIDECSRTLPTNRFQNSH